MSGSGGGSSSTTVQKADPWSGIQPYLASMYGISNNLANAGGPAVYSGPTVAGMTPETLQAADRANKRSMGSPLEAQAQSLTSNIAGGSDPISSYLISMMNSGGLPGSNKNPTSTYMSNVLSGSYLNGNPYLTQAVDAASADTTRNFTTAVMPQLASQFSLAGRYGSGAQSQGISDATNNLAGQLGNISAGIYNQNYQNERGIQNNMATTLNNNVMNATSMQSGRQQQAVANLPGMAAIDWTNIQKQAALGDSEQAYDQQVLNGSIGQFNAQQQAPFQNMQWLNSILNGGLSLSGSSSTQTGGGASTLQSGLGGALGGAAIGGQFGGGYGAAIGGIGGGILGMI